MKFQVTYCSQCGSEFGPGDHGFSHCIDHAPVKPKPCRCGRYEFPHRRQKACAQYEFDHELDGGYDSAISPSDPHGYGKHVERRGI